MFLLHRSSTSPTFFSTRETPFPLEITEIHSIQRLQTDSRRKTFRSIMLLPSRLPAAPRPDGRDVRLVLSRVEFEPSRVRSFACPKLKKSPHLSRVFQSTGNGPAHSQGNGPLCKGGIRCSGVFSACMRRSSSLSTKLQGLSVHRRPSFFFKVLTYRYEKRQLAEKVVLLYSLVFLFCIFSKL